MIKFGVLPNLGYLETSHMGLDAAKAQLNIGERAGVLIKCFPNRT